MFLPTNPTHESVLIAELKWLKDCISARLNDEQLPEAPLLPEVDSTYTDFVNLHKFQDAERLVLAMALSVHLQRDVLTEHFAKDDLFWKAAVVRNKQQNQLLPTFETALFVLSGSGTTKRFQFLSIFEVNHTFYRLSVLEVDGTVGGESIYNQVLSLTPTFRDLFIQNKETKPKFSPDFPAQVVHTRLNWEDMILSPSTASKLQEVRDDLELFGPMIEEWGMQNHAAEGCRILFHGDSGTGKTLAAKLLGKSMGRPVFRVDISSVVSKYVGETSKRLGQLFDMAERKSWILFFDEGDALFGQRTGTSGSEGGSHYANQDTAFLLQRIENFDGIVIVASNLRTNMDAAFIRRFEHKVKFEGLNHEEQHKLWQQVLPAAVSLHSDIQLAKLIPTYSLSPALIAKTAQRVCRMTYKKKLTVIDKDDFLLCLRDAAMSTKGQANFGSMNNLPSR